MSLAKFLVELQDHVAGERVVSAACFRETSLNRPQDAADIEEVGRELAESMGESLGLAEIFQHANRDAISQECRTSTELEGSLSAFLRCHGDNDEVSSDLSKTT